ncbi:50S ribosomal protein L13 [Rickettsiales endosymbiont of Peranema trichophorum]|uniref:50S ribosomal protein L13 n=1 Tax=Rickettsiales endosymbiont of Peranema trichophorum TaxID=2486577 RepID=UPI001023665B|nr:50S ribosomal protein L13 [Rickettsiales endosymbiont of Peranema trichophorum]RZI47315.1 50S ribosomal protein L13 [Rickettsiales endosymbiont of Peranema trichophorum]
MNLLASSRTTLPQVSKNWHLVDASGLVLGRVAAEIAKVLRGKHKAAYTPHIDNGDHVVVINADKIRLTGKKLEQDKFYWHTNYPGGIKERTKGQILKGRYPHRLLLKAIERMMPKDSPLADKQMKALHLYSGGEHPHSGQNPVEWNLKVRNRKNAIKG